jgi:hypothetical protein
MSGFRTSLSVIGVVLLGTVALGIPPRATAQEATPTMAAGEAIDPAGCQVEPITSERLIALWFPEDAATPVPATPEAEPELTSIPLPLGEPADPETVAEITATVRELLACQNRVENGRFFALFTDTMLRQFGPLPGESPENIADVLAPFDPIPVEEQTRLLAVTDISVMPDGRIGALVVSEDPAFPTTEGAHTTLTVFVEDGDRWLVDGIARFTAVEPTVEDEEGPAADSTPTS